MRAKRRGHLVFGNTVATGGWVGVHSVEWSGAEIWQENADERATADSFKELGYKREERYMITKDSVSF